MDEYIHNADAEPKAEICTIVKVLAHNRAKYGQGKAASDILWCLSSCSEARLTDGGCLLAPHCRGEIMTIRAMVNERSHDA